MTNSYAIVDAAGRVERLIDRLTAHIPDGMHIRTLNNPVTMWPAQPFTGAILHAEAGELVWRDKRSLADVKRDKLLEMKAACDAEIGADFATGQGTFSATRDDRQEYVSLMAVSMRLNQLGQNSDVVIEKTNGVPVSATLAEISQLVIAIHNRTQAAYVKLRTVKQQIDAATTVAQVQAITWP